MDDVTLIAITIGVIAVVAVVILFIRPLGGDGSKSASGSASEGASAGGSADDGGSD